jgi:acyl-homoserine lactone acylase PvdQ
MHTVDHNIKIIEAETMMGAMFGLGFAQASDRLW